EAAALDGEIVRKRSRDDRRLLDLDAVRRAVDDGIAARERIDARGDTELAAAELEVGAFVVLRREHAVDDESDRGVELRRERLVQRRELRLHLARDLLRHFLLEAFLV